MGKALKIMQKNIRERMRELNMTQGDLETITKIPQGRISQILSKSPNINIETLEKIAKAIGTDPHKLLEPEAPTKITKEELIRIIKRDLVFRR